MYILKCYRFKKEVEVGVFTSLSAAVWNFYDYMRTCTNTLGLFYHDMDLSLWYNPNVKKSEIDKPCCLISAFNSDDNKTVVIRDDMLYEHLREDILAIDDNVEKEEDLPF